MIDNKKVSSYLLYAMGEVFLVVVGILIAVQIGNWNEKKKVESLANNYLLNIQNELLTDIQTIDLQLEEYSWKDSLIHEYYKADTSKVTDYMNPDAFSMLFVTMQYIPMIPLTNGYQQLLGLDNQLDESYSELIKRLTPLYNQGVDNLDFVNTGFKKMVEAEYEQLNQYGWYGDYLFQQTLGNSLPSYPFTKYSLTNPLHRNRVASYHIHIIGDFKASSLSYQLLAKKSYLKIAHFLKQDSIPEAIDIQELHSELATDYLGEYSSESDNRMKIYEQDSKVYLEREGRKIPYQLYTTKEENTWVALTGAPYLGYIKFRLLGEGKIEKGQFSTHKEMFQKVDSTQ